MGLRTTLEDPNSVSPALKTAGLGEKTRQQKKFPSLHLSLAWTVSRCRKVRSLLRKVSQWEKAGRGRTAEGLRTLGACTFIILIEVIEKTKDHWWINN